MRSNDADIASLADIPEKRQVLAMTDFRVNQPKSRLVMVSNHKPMSHEDILQWESCKALTIRVALAIYKSEEKLSRQQIERILGGSPSSSQAIGRFLRKLQRMGAVSYQEVPHDNEGMMPSHLYFATGAVPIDFLEALLDKAERRESEAVQIPSHDEAVSSADIDDDDTLERYQRTQSVVQFLRSLRKGTAPKYKGLLEHFFDHGELTARQASELSGDSPQTQHGRFSRLLERGFIEREKKDSAEGAREYHYRLVPSVAEEIAELKRKSSQKEEAQAPTTSTEVSVNTMKSEYSPTQATSADQAAKVVQPPSTIELIAGKLPEFDPTWEPEVQANWLQAYQQLLGILKK